MSRLLEILGRAITVDTAELIQHWLEAVHLPCDENKSEQYSHLNKGIELIGRMKHNKAAEQLRIYLFENPSCVYGRLAVAAIYIHNNQLQDAIRELNSVYMRQPNNTMALYALGYCYELLGKEAQAVEFYQDCLKFKSYLQLPAQRLAAVYFKNRQPERTIQQYELLRKEYPDNISVLVTLGHLYIIISKYEQAIEAFQTAILIHPDNFHPEDEDTNQLIAEGQLHDALEQIEDILETQPDRVDMLVKRADVLRMVGATADAISQYEEVVSISPDCLEANIKLGTQYLQINHEQLAAQQFNLAVEINDEIVDAYIGLAIAQKLSGQTSDALGTLSLAAAIQPNSTVLFSQTASLRFKALIGNSSFDGQPDSNDMFSEVIAAHCREIAKRKQNPDLHYRLGVLMMSIGRLQEATESFKIALEINPAFFRAKSKMIVCLYDMGQNAQALDNLSMNECLNKDTLELHYKVALLYCNKIKFASSLMNLERYLEKNFACPEALVNISVVLQNLGLLDRVSVMWDNLSETANQANIYN